MQKDLRLNKAGPLLSVSCRGTELPTGLYSSCSCPWTVGGILLLFWGRSTLPMCVRLPFSICLLEASHPSVQFGQLSGNHRAGPPVAKGMGLSVMFASTRPALPLSFLCVTPASASREWKLGLYLKGRAGSRDWGQSSGLRACLVFCVVCFLMCVRLQAHLK